MNNAVLARNLIYAYLKRHNEEIMDEIQSTFIGIFGSDPEAQEEDERRRKLNEIGTLIPQRNKSREKAKDVLLMELVNPTVKLGENAARCMDTARLLASQYTKYWAATIAELAQDLDKGRWYPFYIGCYYHMKRTTAHPSPMRTEG